MDYIAFGNDVIYMDAGVTEDGASNRILDETFYGFNTLTDCYFSDVEIVGDDSFTLTKLTNLNGFPKLRVCGYRAFQQTLMTEIKSTTLIAVGESGFQNTQATDIYLPNVETLGQQAFAFNSKLTKVTTSMLPKITTISSRCFVYSTLLSNVDLPNVTVVEDSAFRACTNLTNLSMPNAKEFKYGSFYSTKLGSISLPNLETIGDWCFSYTTTLKTANLPVLKTLGTGAFQNCTGLLSIELPLCNYINQQAFRNCTSLKTANLPVCTLISTRMFEGCTSLTTANVPVGTEIKSYSFLNCNSLTNVTMTNCKTIYTSVFQNCTSLTTAIAPACTTIYPYAFDNCTALTNVTIPKCQTIGNYAFQNCTSLKTLELPSLEQIRINCFKDTGIERLILKKLYVNSALTVQGISEMPHLKELEVTSMGYMYNFPNIATCPNLTKYTIWGRLSTIESTSTGALCPDTVTDFLLPETIIYSLGDKWIFSASSNIKNVQLGSAGYPVKTITALNYENNYVNKIKTLKIYTQNGLASDLTGAPWGATNATITYIKA